MRSVSYLLRIWQAGSQHDGTLQMRFLVERICEQPQRRGFESVAALMAYLQAELEDQNTITGPPQQDSD